MQDDLQRNLLIANQFLGEVNYTPQSIFDNSQSLLKIFPDVAPKKMIKAIYDGYTGFYGKTFKLNMQEICIWIRCEIGKCKPDDLRKTQRINVFEEIKKGNHVNL